MCPPNEDVFFVVLQCISDGPRLTFELHPSGYLYSPIDCEVLSMNPLELTFTMECSEKEMDDPDACECPGDAVRSPIAGVNLNKAAGLMAGPGRHEGVLR